MDLGRRVSSISECCLRGWSEVVDGFLVPGIHRASLLRRPGEIRPTMRRVFFVEEVCEPSLGATPIPVHVPREGVEI